MIEKVFEFGEMLRKEGVVFVTELWRVEES